MQIFSAVLALWTLSEVASASINATVSINTGKPIHVTDNRFLSLGMDSNLIRDRWESFDFNSVRLLTLAKGLAPAYLRLSGTDGDRMYFNVTQGQLKAKGDPPFPNSKFSMTVDDWDKINTFCTQAGWDLMFGFNGQIRIRVSHNNTMWNPTNALNLLHYSVAKGYNKHLHFQLGNEPNLWSHHKGEVGVSGAQMAQDFKTLHEILHSLYKGHFDNAVIVGPDIAGLSRAASKRLFIDYLNNIDTSVIKGASFHHYYGGDKTVASYADPKRLDAYIKYVNLIKDIIANSSQPKMPLWNSEAGSTSYPSKSGLEEKFVADFMLVDHLGVSARLGVDVVMRQTFYGFWFALVDNALLPRPTYWFAVLFKRLVDSRVLDINVNVTSSKGDDTAARLRLYAHCAKNSNKGAVTIYGMNLYDTDLVINMPDNTIEQYLLTTDYLGTAITYLNGNRLEMPSNSTLPEMKPKVIDKNYVAIPANSVALYMLPNYKAKACM